LYTKWYTNGIKSDLAYLYNNQESSNTKTNNAWGKEIIDYLHKNNISVGAMLQLLTYEKQHWNEGKIGEWDLRHVAKTDSTCYIADFTDEDYIIRMQDIIKEQLTIFPDIDYLFLEFEGDQLGIISPHEHLYIDIRNQFREFSDISRRAISEQRVGIYNLDKLSRNPYAVRDNLILDNEKTAVNELLEFKAAGGDTIVDATPASIGRDPIALRRRSRLLDINIIAGCGYYTHDIHPAYMDCRSIDAIYDEIMTDLTVGIDGTSIKSGVIGEIGISLE
jgi:hypothetical protein